MDEAIRLHNELSAIRLKLRRILARKGAVRGGLAAGIACLVLLALSRLLPEWDAPAAWPVLLLLGPLAGAAWGWRRTPDLFRVARWAEDRLALKERLSTAVELGGARGEPMGPAVVSDAVRTLRDAEDRSLYPKAVDRPMKLLAGVFLLCLVLALMPDLGLLRSPARRAEAATVRLEGTRLERTAVEMERQAERRGLPAEKQIAANLKALGRDMRRNKLGQKEALLRLNKLTDQMKKNQDLLARAGAGPKGERLSPETAREKLQRSPSALPQTDFAASPFDEAAIVSPELSRKLMEFAKAGDQAPKGRVKAENDLLSRIAERLASKDYKGAAQAFNDLAKQLRDGNLTPEERKKLAQRMRDLARLMEQSDMKGMARRLNRAAGLAEKGNTDKAAELMERNARDLNRMEMLREMLAKAGECKNGICPTPFGQKVARNDNEFGPSTDKEQRARKGIGNSPNESRPDKAAGKWDRLYDPRRTAVKTRDVKSPGRIGEKGAAYSTDVVGAPDKVSPSSVPYYEADSAYRKEAEKALSREEVPPAYRKPVRDYFDSLKGE
ncbi:MAG: hypothetical protein KY468_15105 [Armatimonadetes bacterium]|nr:hypothetical protein [Armatimonadota bacterium]